MRPAHIFALVTVLLGTGAFGVVAAQSSKTDEAVETRRKLDYLQSRLNQMEGRIDRMSRDLEESTKSLNQLKADQSVTMEDLRTDLKSLRGAFDVLRHDLDENLANDKKLHEDFDSRLSAMETKGSASKGGERGNAPGDDIARYNEILRQVLDKKDYEAAIEQFGGFIRDYPNSALLDNAQYWLAEGYFSKGEYRQAISEFQRVVERYPESKKVCDAIFKQGASFALLKDTRNARLFYTEVTKRCANTKIASQASQRLKGLAPAAPKK